MADNIDVTAGSGKTIAADDIGGILHQRVKISQGADGSASDVSSANPLPVSLLSSISISALNAGGSLSAFQGGAWNVGNIGGSLSAFQGGSWLVSVATLPVMANIVNSSIPVTQSGTWDEVGINDSGNSITIDGNVGVIGGSLSTWAAGGSLSAFQGGSWGVWASMMSNTIIQVGDNGGSLTIDGTVTANLSATDNAVLDDIAADTEAIKTAVEGTLTVTGGGGGVEYTEGDTDSTITGSALMWEDTSDTLRAVSAAKPLPVDIQDSTLAVTQSGTWTVQPGNTPNSTAWLVTMATLPVVGDFSLSGEIGVAGGSISNWNAGGSLSAFQGGTWTVQPGNTPNTTAWLVTMATLSTMARNVGGSLSAYVFGGSISAFNAGGSLSAVNIGGSLSAFQGGSWNMANVGGSVSSYVFGGSLSAFNAGGSISAFQGGTWNVFSSMASGTNFIAGGQYLPTLASLSSMAHTPLKTDMFSNLMVNTNVPFQNNTRLNRFYSFASMASLMAAPGSGKRLVVRELDITAGATLTVRLVEDQGGTPATVWGPHYFLPYSGITKNDCYIAITSNKSLGVNASGIGDMQIDLRVETENV